MLYVFHGTDIKTSHTKSTSLVASLRTKRPDATFVKIDKDNWSSSIVEEHLGGQGLFSNKYIIVLDRVTENAAAKHELPEFIPAMKESSNIFIILEGKVLVDLKKALEKSAEKLVTSDLRVEGNGFKKTGMNEFNIFQLADAFGERNRLKSWSIYRQAVDRGIEVESIIGTLFWQAKSIALVAKASSATQAGLSPFVFSKAKRYAANYSSAEIGELLSKLVGIYHEGHRGMVDTELALERLLLADKTE